jgi:FkbM family methyltransferase
MFKNTYKNISYSQCGEDLIMDFLFRILKIKNPKYIDIGAHHPFYLSNTALFYEKGSQGICIEPDPILFKELKKQRENDICLNIGIGLHDEEEVDFYIMSTPTLNTFSKIHAENYVSQGNQKIVDVKKITLYNINTIIKMYCETTPNLISLDIEGLDFEVLQSFDFLQYRPEVFCIETLTYTEDNNEKKLINIIDYMISQGYKVYSDTYINTIFVDEVVWKNRQ